jgi:hypothetical protein
MGIERTGDQEMVGNDETGLPCPVFLQKEELGTTTEEGLRTTG